MRQQTPCAFAWYPISTVQPPPFPVDILLGTPARKKKKKSFKEKTSSHRPRITLHHRQPLIFIVRTAAPWLARTEAPSVIRKETACVIAKAAPSTIGKAEAAAIGKAASMAVGEATPVSQARAQAAAGACRRVIRTAVHVPHPGVFDAVKGNGVVVVVMAVGGAVAGAGGLMAHGRGEDVALRVDAAAGAGPACRERGQG